MTRDVEYWVLKLIDYVKSNLNTKIAEINTEKADAVTLKTVDSEAYYYTSFGSEMPMFDPVVIFSVSSGLGENSGSEPKENIRITIEMVVADGMESDREAVLKTMLRYRRALKETITDRARAFNSLSIVDLPDQSFIVNQSQYWTLGLGVSFSIVL